MPDPYPPTVIVRHHKENLRKCTVRGFGSRDDTAVFVYPDCVETLQPLAGRIWLTLKGDPLTSADIDTGLVLLDATWRHEAKMVAGLRSPLMDTHRRSIPTGFVTAYPRRQTECPDPSAGLATVEALYIACRILGRDTADLLADYRWADRFLEVNAERLAAL